MIVKMSRANTEEAMAQQARRKGFYQPGSRLAATHTLAAKFYFR